MPGLVGTMSWIAVSPDDRYLGVPLFRPLTPTTAGGKPVLQGAVEIVDLKTTKITTIPDALGPVAFSADGSTLVAFRAIPDKNARSRFPKDRDLVLVHLPTMKVETVPTPFPGGLSFFVTHQGSWVVLASSGGGKGYALHDLSTGKTKILSTTGGTLFEFISRAGKDELWLVDHTLGEGLRRMDLNAETVTTVPLPFSPRHINWLPGVDRLVLDETKPGTLHFFDPNTSQVTMDIKLPALPTN